MDNKIDFDEFIGFWDESNFFPGTKIHKEDYVLLKSKLVENCHNFDEYIEKYIDEPQDKKFHPDLWTSPYCGDLRNGEIFILSLNPGFDCDYYYEKDVEVKQVLKNNLSQNLTNEKYPFTKQENDNLIIYEGCECLSASLWKNEKARDAILKKM